ncbi:protein Mis18-alpha isoform X2 [Centropristis striata]|uniref:protein Mis18-alpha isoform X2 n=1 Tax=Centropristis striata TaxID=184440 RepID=UPI0027DF420E|nr:protein Mis18-alpha isoform X2 [Centropristis striata]
MASGGEALKRRQKSLNITYESGIDSTIVEEKSFDQAEEDEDEEDEPVVFICGKCKLPVGDSMSWDGSEDVQNQIRLKRVTDNVVMGTSTRMHEISKQSVCLIVDLICRGCDSVLGMVYSSTPKDLDHKRFAFFFNVANIDSYVLGSASQMLAAEGPEEQPVTLESRGTVEQQLAEMKLLVLSMAQRLEEIEFGLMEESDAA